MVSARISMVVMSALALSACSSGAPTSSSTTVSEPGQIGRTEPTAIAAPTPTAEPAPTPKSTPTATSVPTATPEATPEPEPFAVLSNGTEVWMSRVETGELVDPDTGLLVEGVWANKDGDVSTRIYNRCSNDMNIVGQIDGVEICGTPILGSGTGTDSGCLGFADPVELDFPLLHDFIVPYGAKKGEHAVIIDYSICVFPNDAPKY